MGLFEITIIAFAISIDASIAAMANSISDSKINFRKALLICLTFSIFQVLMPLTSYFGSFFFHRLNERITHIIAFIILSIIGIRMVMDSNKAFQTVPSLSYSKIILQGIATSLDALIVGLSFHFLSIRIELASLIIFIITFINCLIFIYFGKKISIVLSSKSLFFGGWLLIVVAFKILLNGI